MDPFVGLVRAFLDREVRFVVIGVWGANYYAHSGATMFTTRDRDIFLPRDPDNLLRAWESCTAAGLILGAGNEPLDLPRDLPLARTVIERQAATIARGDRLEVDLSVVMEGFTFEQVWAGHRTFAVEGVDIPVARLTDIVASKARLGRPKDRLFLATHAEALKQLLTDETPPPAP